MLGGVENTFEVTCDNLQTSGSPGWVADLSFLLDLAHQVHKLRFRDSTARSLINFVIKIIWEGNRLLFGKIVPGCGKKEKVSLIERAGGYFSVT